MQDNNIGLGELENETEIIVFPNPTNGSFRIDNLIEKAEITIFSMNGQRILTKSILPGETIDIQNFGKGNYLLEVKLNESEKRRKLISIH